MIDIKMLREDPEAFRARLGRKRFDPELFDRVVSLDAEHRKRLTEVESLRAEKKTRSKAIGKARPEEREALLAETRAMGDRLSAGEDELKTLSEELESILVMLPNPPHESAADGAGEEDNAVLRHVGKKPSFDFEVRDHVALGELTGTLDVSRASRLSGSRFVYTLGGLVHLELALVNYAMGILGEEGFTPAVTPVLVREAAMYGTGFFPAEKFEIYHLQQDDLYLVGTSEVALAGFHMDEILPVEELPVRFAGFSTCFRREAGAYGKDTKGMFRVHQFDKVEMFSFCHPDRSWEEHEKLLALEEKIVGGLGIPYQVVNVCTGDLGAPAAKKYDVEAWFPGQGAYREVTSCSNCTDFQARRLKTRFKEDGKNRHVHTLNGTAVAVGRTMIAIMENFQEADGSIRLPEVLHRYLPTGMTTIAPRS